MATYSSIIDHPVWDELINFIILDPCTSQNRWRINVSTEIPLRLVQRAFKAKVQCANAHCDKLIHPIRGTEGWGVYFSSTCPQIESIKCSRSAGAIKECKRIRDAVTRKQNNLPRLSKTFEQAALF